MLSKEIVITFLYYPLYVDVKEPAGPGGHSGNFANPVSGFWRMTAPGRKDLRRRAIRGSVLFSVAFLERKGQAVVGVTGFEPVTLRLSSACSNQLSYTPACAEITAPKFQSGTPLEAGWRHGDSNPGPIACKATALPAELYPQILEVEGD